MAINRLRSRTGELNALPFVQEETSMKLVLTLLGVVLLVIAAVYFVLPADQLPGFFPGHETGVARMLTSTASLPGLSAWCCWRPAHGWDGGEGRRRHHGRVIRRRDTNVAPGDEPCASPHPKCAPARRSRRLHLGGKILELARDRRPALVAVASAR